MGGHHNHRRARRVRSAVIGVAALIPLAPFWAGVGLAAPTSPAAPTQEAGVFTFGSGKAQAGLVTPALLAGQLSVALVVGDATAAYQDETARAGSTSFDIPLFRAASGTTVCGQPGVDFGAFLPAPVNVDTGRDGNTAPVAAAGADTAGLLVQTAEASPGAASRSETSIADLDIPGVATIGGAEAITSVTADPATQTRTASAEVTVGRVDILGGLLSFEGLRWTLAQEQVGPDDRDDVRSVEGAFSIGAVVVNLGPLPLRLPVADPSQLASVIGTVNQLLGPLGVQVRLPEVRHFEGIDRHQVTPLEIVVGGEDFLLAPVLGQVLTNPAVGQLQGLLLDGLFDPAECNQLFGLLQGAPELNGLYNTLGSYAPLIIAAATGVVSGGEVNLSVGGVTTELDDRYFEAPDFGGPSFGSPAPTPPPPAAPTPAVPAAPPVVGAPPPVVAAPPAIDTALPPAAPAAAVDTVCLTESPAGRPGCWLGRAGLAGLLATTVAFGSLGVDEVLRRRRRGLDVPGEEAR